MGFKECGHEVTGYSVGIGAWFWKMLPGSCEGWTHVFALLIVAVTFFFVTMPKAWDFQKKRWTKRK